MELGTSLSSGLVKVNTGDGSLHTTFEADGDVNINNGNLVIGTAGKGINFGIATDVASVAESGSSLGMTLNFAEYTKIGRAVHFILHVTFGSGSDGSAVQLTGFPFNGNTSKIQTVNVFTNYTGGTIVPYLQGTTIFMSKNNATVDLSYSDVSGKYVRMSGTMQII